MTEEKQGLNYPVLGSYIHRFFGVELNGLAWELLGTEERSERETFRMLAAAHASLYHWLESTTDPINEQRGQWLISHIYALLGLSQGALLHAKRCLTITEDNDIEDFDLAFAYEAMARAFLSAGEKEEYEKYYKMAIDAGNLIADKDDKEVFDTTIGTCK